VSKAAVALKRVAVGRPRSSAELENTLLPKFIALPVFSSDPLSSNAYATQEILLVLALVGSSALALVVPIAIAVAFLLVTVTVSYSQTLYAYPNGGGAYIVAHDNLGTYPGLVAAAALLVDYVLTVSVSVVGGVDAIISALPELTDSKIPLALGFVVLVALANLRGVRESGSFFAIPTYGFVLSVYALLATGFVKCLSACPQAASAGIEPETQSALTFFIILKAFSAGTTALTGVEAISNAVPAFKYPKSRNAATTLAMMAALSITMFLGISVLANRAHVVFTEGSAVSALAQIGEAVFGRGIMFFLLQAMTAGILILAANTAFAGFPVLSSILARDRFMPRQLMNRGDKLVFSNGIVILAFLAAVLVVAFDANLNSLIQLYLIGVFVSFTLSQAGMVVHWRKSKAPGWRTRQYINGFGAAVTGGVFVVVVQTKFAGGAWIVVVAIPIIVYLMYKVNRHYGEVGRELRRVDRKPRDRRPGNQHMTILVNDTDEVTVRAIGYARSIHTDDIEAVTLDGVDPEAWQAIAPNIPLKQIDTDGSHTAALRRYLRHKRKELTPEDFLTVVIPEALGSRSFLEIFKRPRLTRLKAALVAEPDVQVLDLPIVKSEVKPSFEQAAEPARNYAIVLVSGVHNATLQALEYAETLRPTDIRAITFGLDPEASERLGKQWLEWDIPHPLEIEDSPFRDIGESLVEYVRAFKADGVHRVVTIVIPEFLTTKWWHKALHNKTALIVKGRMLFEPGVVVVSVPYHLGHR